MSLSLNVIRFNFIEPLHVSNPRSDYARTEEIIRSDTLSAAIMQTWALLGKEEWITGNPGFVTSSLFPFTQSGDEMVYMFPKPVKDQLKTSLSPTQLKKFKKVRYYDQDYFEQRLSGPLEIEENDIKDEFLSKKLRTGQEGLYKSTVTPRIMRPRDPQADTRIFYMERRSFNQGAGLFCILHSKSDEAKNRFLAGLRLSADNGLGSDRTVGHGRFTFTEDTISLKQPVGSDSMIGLSLYIPSSRNELIEALDPRSRYELIRRGGWISEPFNTLRKRSIYMFSEGSLFTPCQDSLTVKGKTVDVKPVGLKTHPAIYRSGEGIFLPIKTS